MNDAIGNRRNAIASASRFPSAEVVTAFSRWSALCKEYLPIIPEGTFWRYSRKSVAGEPLQGWKLHVSATVVEACEVFEKVAPVLAARNVRFKAPGSLADLIEVNCGLKYGYSQVGKFVTVYPASEEESVDLAAELHRLTAKFAHISVPFDAPYAPESSVFYRYGSYVEREIIGPDGRRMPAITDHDGNLVVDDTLTAIPQWVSSPFFRDTVPSLDPSPHPPDTTPLRTTYSVFQAMTQRGKGGTYKAIDLGGAVPRLCVIKQGRRQGEAYWNGQDGYYLARHEHDVLTDLGKNYDMVPRVYSSFEANKDFYLVMEYIESESLHNLIRLRRRRLSVKQLVKYAISILRIIEKINAAGWIWNDCKPENLLIDKTGEMRPIDFENAYRIGEVAPFNWKSHSFSAGDAAYAAPSNSDTYAFAATIFFLTTGRHYNNASPVMIEERRRGVPEEFAKLVHGLLSGNDLKAKTIRKRLELMAENT